MPPKPGSEITAPPAPPPPDDLPSELPLSSSLIVTERVYLGPNNVWVLAGTFNRLNIHIQKFDPNAKAWMIPSMGIYYKAQWHKKKEVQLIFVVRILSVNNKPCKGAKTIAQVAANLKEETNYSGDGAFTSPHVAVEIDPWVAPKPGENIIVYQVETWRNHELTSYAGVTLTLTAEEEAE